jgi:hypothetical protein
MRIRGHAKAVVRELEERGMGPQWNIDSVVPVVLDLH